MSPKAEGGLWNSQRRAQPSGIPQTWPAEVEGHLITNFPTYHGISL